MSERNNFHFLNSNQIFNPFFSFPISLSVPSSFFLSLFLLFLFTPSNESKCKYIYTLCIHMIYINWIWIRSEKMEKLIPLLTDMLVTVGEERKWRRKSSRCFSLLFPSPFLIKFRLFSHPFPSSSYFFFFSFLFLLPLISSSCLISSIECTFDSHPTFEIWAEFCFISFLPFLMSQLNSILFCSENKG